MARDFQIPGGTMVYVRGGAHLSGTMSILTELGMSDTQIHVTPYWSHKNIPADDFGPNVPPELQYQLLGARIRMSLIDVDYDVLDTCVSEANVGGQRAQAGHPNAGTVGRPGGMVGRNKIRFASGNHYIGLTLRNPLGPDFYQPWRFMATTLTTNPYEEKIGVQANVIDLEWQAIPYVTPTKYVQTVSGRIDMAYRGDEYYSGLVLIDFENEVYLKLKQGKVTVVSELQASGAIVWDRLLLD